MTANSIKKNWRDCILKDKGKIKDVINSLNISSSQVVIIEHSDNSFKGIITDGDLRRSMLDGYTLEDDFQPIVNTNPITVSEGVNENKVLEIMMKNDIHQIPIIKNKKIIGLHTIDNLIAQKNIDNTIVIMAGGKGMRLRPYTENCPKPMLIVGDRPMLHHIIDKAKSEGFSNFVITTHYLTHVIEDYFMDGSKFGVNISYTREDKPLGTAGALNLISKNIIKKPFIVTNGDVMTDIKFSDILKFHIKNNAFATMATRPYQLSHPYGVIEINGIEIESFKEKPIYHSHINAGVYVLDPKTIEILGNNEHCDMPSLLKKNKDKNKKIIAYPMHEPWIDVGRVEDLNTIRKKDSTE